jgi:hypothetical protein
VAFTVIPVTGVIAAAPPLASVRISDVFSQALH